MRKLMLAAGVAVLCLGTFGIGSIAAPSAAMAGDFAAIAAGDGGFGWVQGGYGSMEGARRAAKRACRNEGYGSCESSVAERSSWYFAGGSCDGRAYVGAGGSQESARRQVRRKAAADGYGDCNYMVEF